MHGGRSSGPRTKLGRERSRSAALKHGRYTKEAKASHSEVLDFIKRCKNNLRLF
jgi:hypothetical protein